MEDEVGPAPKPLPPPRPNPGLPPELCNIVGAEIYISKYEMQ